MAEALEFHSRGRAAVVAMSMDYKAMKDAVATWVAMLAAIEVRHWERPRTRTRAQ